MSAKTKTKEKDTPPSSSNNASANESTFDNLDTSISAKEAPYGTDYAKSGRAKCKGCNELIPKGVLRMAVRYQSKFFDGFQENWHHFECFWKKSRKNDINEASIRGMEWLKWSDQEQIRQRIEELKSSGSGSYTPKSAAVKVEHAKTGAGKCFICKEKIEKGQIRISSRASFHHVKCFADQKSFQKSADELVGYDELEDEERAQLDEMFPKKQMNTAEKKRKLESIEENGEESQTPVKKPKADGNDKDLKKTLKKQSEVLWETRQALKDNVQKEDMEMLLNLNGGHKSKKDGIEGMVDKLVDMIVYGPPEKCPECDKGRLSYKTDIHAYKCSGNVSEYAPCLYTSRNPERTKFYIPKDMKEGNAFLKKLKSPILPERVYPPGALEEMMASGSKAFKRLDFVSKHGSTSNGKSGKSSNDGQKLVVKHGNVVDPKCTVATNSHVYVDPETKRPWQANLTAMDISTGKNSYYKLQIVKDDHEEEFYLFRSWGRIGTISGGSKTEDYGDDLERCKEDFEHHFLDKTQNTWEDYIGGKFKKVARGMDVLEIDYSSKKEDKRKQKLDVSGSKSKLPKEIKELISMVFDINTLTDTMKEFEIDMEKMPLGRLSRNHILKAYKVLTELQQVLEKQQNQQNEEVMEVVPKHQFIDFTNRFYTLIPHATGLATPPLLNNLQILREKTQMLDSLLEIEIAFNIITKDFEQIDGKDAFDVHYEQLKCSMEVLDQNSDEFKMIKRYLENTHATTHHTQLEIVNVLKIEREEETKRFKKEIGNRHLLWHGSRLSNYAGILSQGLRIAPPEAPVTGYMFGKGIYTADMVTKSANYCYTMDGEGLLLLCDVALGNMQLEKDGKDIKKPKKGKNSVKGVGGTGPNPAENEHFGEMTVPCGKPIKNNEQGLTLLYNEYIVYDEAQIQMRYVCRVKFNNKLL